MIICCCTYLYPCRAAVRCERHWARSSHAPGSFIWRPVLLSARVSCRSVPYGRQKLWCCWKNPANQGGVSDLPLPVSYYQLKLNLRCELVCGWKSCYMKVIFSASCCMVTVCSAPQTLMKNWTINTIRRRGWSSGSPSRCPELLQELLLASLVCILLLLFLICLYFIFSFCPSPVSIYFLCLLFLLLFFLHLYPFSLFSCVFVFFIFYFLFFSFLPYIFFLHVPVLVLRTWASEGWQSFASCS